MLLISESVVLLLTIHIFIKEVLSKINPIIIIAIGKKERGN